GRLSSTYGRTVSQPDRVAAGNARPSDPGSVAVGAAAWPRNRRGHPGQLAGCAAGGARVFVSGPAPAAQTGTDRSRVADDREQTARAVLQAHRQGQEGAGGRRVALEPHGGGNRAGDPARLGGYACGFGSAAPARSANSTKRFASTFPRRLSFVWTGDKI